MTGLFPTLLTGLLVLAAVLFLAPRHHVATRLWRLLGRGGLESTLYPPSGSQTARTERRGRWPASIPGLASRMGFGRARVADGPQNAMTLVVQQMAALLKGGRNQARLWEELMMVHAGPSTGSPHGATGSIRKRQRPETGRTLGRASLDVVAAARGASTLGLPVSAAIRSAALRGSFVTGSRERRVWFNVAACVDVADASGCPLADVLTRLAAQLEAEDDAEAARQTALAGPKSTVTLLSWLPLTGLGLGVALGVDPFAMLLGTPIGFAALVAGAVLTVAGRVWSARLVRSAAVDPA